jgi:N-acetylneuraminic acid mutarotase
MDLPMNPNQARPNAGQWQLKSPIIHARSHCPPAVYKNKIYVFGGGGPHFASLNSVYAYDPQKDAWERKTDMPTLRSGSVTAVLGDRVYVMGGGFKQPNGQFRFLTAVEIYHPETDSWEKGPDLLMPHDYPAVAVLDGYIYVLGGHHPDATKAGPKTDPGFDFCERLNPAKGVWEEVAPLQQPRFALAAAAVNGAVLTMGGVAFTPDGFNNFTLVERYDPAQNRWSRDDRYTLPWPAAGLGACMLNKRLYIFGGYSTDNIHNRAACFDEASGAWKRIPDLPAPRAAMGVATLEGTIYLIGGWADDGRTPQADVYALHVDER